jgi:hypothetical protein
VFTYPSATNQYQIDTLVLQISVRDYTRNVRHGHMSSNTTVTFRNINNFAIRFLILLGDKISEILSGFDNNW